MNWMFHMGRYWSFIRDLLSKPEKFSIYWKQLVRELDNFGWGSLGIVALVSVFMGAVITIQTVYNLVNPLVPMSAVGIVARDSIILEFSPTMICLVLAGKIGSSIASEIGTMRVTEQIDALEIMGINSKAYLVMPKIAASLLTIPLLVILSMALGIWGGRLAGTFSGILPADVYDKGLLESFVPYNVLFAMYKAVTFAFIISSIPAYYGYFVKGGALEIGRSSTKSVVVSCVMILFADYVLAAIFLN